MTTVSGLRAYTAAELLARPFPVREAILEPWLRAEETAVIWSASGVGKTWMSLSIALAVAGGGACADWRAPTARRVLYLDGEMNQADLQGRIRGLLEMGAVVVPDRELALGNLTIIARQGQELGSGFFDLTAEEDQRSILDMVQGRAELVVFDNLTTMSEGLREENAAAEFKPLQGLFMELKRAGVAAILVHHANKSGKDLRGSTALETTFEVILGLLKPGVRRPGKASFVTEFTKFRGQGDERLEARTWELGEGGWSIADQVFEDAREDPVVRAVRSLDFVTQEEIAAKLGLDKSTVSRRLKRAEAQGTLRPGELRDRFKSAKELRESGPDLEGFETVGEAAEESF